MRSQHVPSDVLAKGIRAVHSYLRVARQERFTSLRVADVLCAAEAVWNNYEPGRGPPDFAESSVESISPRFEELVHALQAERSRTPAEERFFLFALDCNDGPEDDEVGDDEAGDGAAGGDDPEGVVLWCDLMWPDREGIHSLQVRVPGRRHRPPPWR